ncbi:CLUMA_CG014081, isoform A [Clunio marinus]|uniref:CLUMA_CG014081, isoform A n=1 Tax=Clunio marinus TaxID=568069 RepID=A0A1J1IP24_9DIPT|nr:CLUMA_CG014081, isoform A [Clunio marinus]
MIILCNFKNVKQSRVNLKLTNKLLLFLSSKTIKTLKVIKLFQFTAKKFEE